MTKRLSIHRPVLQGHQQLLTLGLSYRQEDQGLSSPPWPALHPQPLELFLEMAGLGSHTTAPSPGETQVQMGIPTTSAFPVWVILPSPVSANEGPPCFHSVASSLCPRVSFTFSLCHLHLALGSESIYGKTRHRSSGKSGFALKREPGMPGMAPHSTPVPFFFSLARITPPTPASHRTSTPSISAHHTTRPMSRPAASAPRPSPRPPTSSRRLLTMSARVLSHWPVSKLSFSLTPSSQVKQLCELSSKRNACLHNLLSSPLYP